MRRLLVVLGVVGLLVWGAAFHLLRVRLAPPLTVLPTLMVLPTWPPTATRTVTPVPYQTAAVTATPTLTPSPTITMPPPLMPTATLATRVVALSAVMPGVPVAPQPTAFPFGTILLPAAPPPLEPLADATDLAPPYTGWISFESDHPQVQYRTPWLPVLNVLASRGQYHRTEAVQTAVTLAFAGEGLRIRYVAARNMGRFQVRVDGVLLDTIDAYAPQLQFPGTRVYTLTRGPHLLTLQPEGQKHPQSSGYAVGLDGVQVFQGDAHTLILTPPPLSATPSPLPQPVAVELVQSPPEPPPARTSVPPLPITVAVLVAYDENGNRAVDPAEGVSGIPVWVVEAGSNRVIAQAFTDPAGFAQTQVLTGVPARVVVPYLSRVWELPRGSTSAGAARFTLLLPAANQPGLIP